MADATPAVPECRWDGDHHDQALEREDIARLSEGFCCDCQIPSQRDDGWTRCPCCHVGWRLEGEYLLVRFNIHEQDQRP